MMVMFALGAAQKIRKEQNDAEKPKKESIGCGGVDLYLVRFWPGPARCAAGG